MRDEIKEPTMRREHLSDGEGRSWSTRRRRGDAESMKRTPLRAELVDAALADQNMPTAEDLASTLSAQLAMLEAQREQLCRLLEEVKSGEEKS